MVTSCYANFFHNSNKPVPVFLYFLVNRKISGNKRCNVKVPLKLDKKVKRRGIYNQYIKITTCLFMLSSGAGKTTLMSILAGFKYVWKIDIVILNSCESIIFAFLIKYEFRTSNVTGEITVNHKLRNLKRFRKSSCLIMQVIQLDNYNSKSLWIKIWKLVFKTIEGRSKP